MKRTFGALYLAGVVVKTIVRLPHVRERSRIQHVDQRVSLAERGLISWLFFGMVIVPLAYTLTRWLDFADYPLSRRGRTGLGMLGLPLLVAAGWLFHRSHSDLGTNWSASLEIGERQTLVTRGVYRSIRHPMYASEALWATAQALLLPNWIAGLAGWIGFLPLYLVRVPREERMMLDHFGEEYRAYCERTGRIVPRLSA
jgi:protein-S-isoprenylcysteine O-methyltransferase Ste14